MNALSTPHGFEQFFKSTPRGSELMGQPLEALNVLSTPRGSEQFFKSTACGFELTH